MNKNEFYAQIRAFCLNSDKEDVYKYIYCLQQEDQQLKDRINKAIEYINDLSLDFYDYECERLIVGKYVINDLLKILKGYNKEEK